MASQHPEWKTTQPSKALLDKDMKAFAANGEKTVVDEAGLEKGFRVRAVGCLNQL